MLLTFFSTCSSPRLGMLFCSSARVRPCCWECSFLPLWVRSCLPAVGPLFWLLVSGIIQSGRVYPDCWLQLELCSLPGVAACECVSLAPRAPTSHRLRSVIPISRIPSPLHVLTHVFDSACSLTCCSRSGSPQPHRLTPSALHVQRCPPELECSGSSLHFSAWSWTPPCRVCGHSCASPGTPRRWSLCLEGLLSAPFVGLCFARFPAIVHCGPPSVVCWTAQQHSEECSSPSWHCAQRTLVTELGPPGS